MFLHIGNGKSIRESEIVGIFDLDSATVSKITKNYLSAKEKSGDVEYEIADLPRSFIVCAGKNNEKIMLSRMSAPCLADRAEGKEEIETAE